MFETSPVSPSHLVITTRYLYVCVDITSFHIRRGEYGFDPRLDYGFDSLLSSAPLKTAHRRRTFPEIRGPACPESRSTQNPLQPGGTSGRAPDSGLVGPQVAGFGSGKGGGRDTPRQK